MKHCSVIMHSCALVLAVACSRYEPSQEILDDGPSSSFVSMSQAESEVLKLLASIDIETKGCSSNRRIVERFSLGGPDTKTGLMEDPLIYVFNFNDEKGFAIASGDNRMPPVFCLTEKGSLSDTACLPEGAIAMLSRIDTDYRMILGLPVSDFNGNTITQEQYGQYAGLNNIREGDPVPETETVYTNWQTEEIIGTSLKCKWNQTSPFNHFCKTTEGKEAYVGCVPVAVGQVMYYWGKSCTYVGYSYDWNLIKRIIASYIPSYPHPLDEAWDQVQHLLFDLGRRENLNVEYGEVDNSDGSFASSNNIERTFLNFGYSDGGTECEYNLSVLKNELLMGPVLGSGYSKKVEKVFLGIVFSTEYDDGHSWVYDQCKGQYRIRKVIDKNTREVLRSSKEVRMLVRCNWGWGGISDGFYLSGSFNTSDDKGLITKATELSSEEPGFYQYALKMRIGIRP